MEPSITLLLCLSTAFNVWFVLSIRQKSLWSAPCIFLLQLAVADFFHDLHAELFKILTSKFMLTKHSDWLQFHQFIGFVWSLVPLLAVLVLLLKEVLHWPKGPVIYRTWDAYIESFKKEFVVLFFVALLTASPVLIMAKDFAAFGFTPYTQEFSVHSIHRLSMDIVIEDHFESPSFGILSRIPAMTQPGYVFLQRAFECASNPLWFPLACLCVLPAAAFVLLKRETERSRSGFEDSQLLLKESAEDDKEVYLQLLKLNMAKKRLLLGLFAMYYGIFLYDLFSLGDESESNEQQLEYTHSTRSKPDSEGLEVVFVFHHWTRPLGAVLRNAFVAYLWHMEHKCKIIHV